MTDWKYCVPGMVGWCETRHEAIGKAAIKAGNGEHPGPFEFPEEMGAERRRENILDATRYVQAWDLDGGVVMPI